MTFEGDGTVSGLLRNTTHIYGAEFLAKRLKKNDIGDGKFKYFVHFSKRLKNLIFLDKTH